MAKLIAIYRTPKDKSAFDAYYSGTHAPLAKKIPGLTKYEVSTGAVASPTGTDDVHLIAVLHFATLADIQKALASAEGQAAASDLGNFADGGVDLLMFDDRPI